MNSKKVLVLVESISRRNGGASSALDLIEAFNKLGYEFDVGVTNYAPIAYKIMKRSIINFSTKRIKYVDQKIVSSRLKSYFRKIYSMICFNKIGIKHLNKYDFIIDITVLEESLIGELKKHTNAVFVKNHAGSVETFKKYRLGGTIKSDCEYFNKFKNHDRILFQSRNQSLESISEVPEFKDKPIVIEPSCDEETVLRSLFSSSPYNKNNNKLILVNVGSIQKRKGQVLSVRLANELTQSGIDCELHLVGGTIDQDYLIKIKKEAKVLGVEDLLFIHGHKDNYLDYMAHSDMILQTSYSEGVSRILRESMLLEKPIATFSISGTNDLLDNECAILAEPFNEKELSQKIVNTIKAKDRLYNLKKAALDKYISNNSKTVYYKKILSAF